MGDAEKLQRSLDRAREDFEEFISMAAHNLRDSLRDVAANSQLLTQTYANQLDPKPAFS